LKAKKEEKSVVRPFKRGSGTFATEQCQRCKTGNRTHTWEPVQINAGSREPHSNVSDGNGWKDIVQSIGILSLFSTKRELTRPCPCSPRKPQSSRPHTVGGWDTRLWQKRHRPRSSQVLFDSIIIIIYVFIHSFLLTFLPPWFTWHTARQRDRDRDWERCTPL